MKQDRKESTGLEHVPSEILEREVQEVKDEIIKNRAEYSEEEIEEMRTRLRESGLSDTHEFARETLFINDVLDKQESEEELERRGEL